MARTYAFTVLVFAELLRSFGARSERTSVWRIPLSTNMNLVAVVAVSLGLQVLSQHNAILSRFLKSSFMPLTDALVLLALGIIPLAVLELVKIASQKSARQSTGPAPTLPQALQGQPE